MIKQLQKLIDGGVYPIVHINKGYTDCPVCDVEVGEQEPAECIHFLILTSYTPFFFYARLITNSNDSYYANIKAKRSDYSLSGRGIFSPGPINYYSSNSFPISNSCIQNCSYRGKFTRL